MDKPTQFHRRRKQLNVRFAPLGSISQLVGVIEDTFQSSEAGILAQHLPFLGRLRPTPFDTEAKRHPYSLDVVAHGIQTVIGHSRRVFP